MYAEGTYFLSVGVAVNPPSQAHTLSHIHAHMFSSSMVTLYAVYFAIYFISKKLFFKNIEIAEKFLFLRQKMKAINPSFVLLN